ncbi:PREDICTED: uncharacterized protein LOC109585429 [Amphimedon queenslandica]|uniref:Uncharacterized protein n=1 Tax=Amphimedon queenslandica TaxID=400682 RepID=A0A1X7TYN2_AMPQE|nr:PREDICTED: uncharacterized protein LOC109585429 [Amphimedon queenslandica]|eukprot:XP_019857068.1 PREDICTED: uncharacterized protein LOC109585429 [Amphimedon queenslandica]
MKVICVLMLLLCACKAFGEGPANDLDNFEGFVQPEEEQGFEQFDELNSEVNNNNEEFNEADYMNQNEEQNEIDSEEAEDSSIDGENVSKETFEQVMSKSYDETANAPAMQGNINRTVCYLRICAWVTKKIRQYYPVSTKHNYTQHYPVTVKVPIKSHYACGQTPYNVTRPYQVKVPHNKKTCHVYHGHKYCSHKTIYEWETKFRTFTLYKPKMCTKSSFKITIVYKVRTLPGKKTIYKYRLATIKRYICSYKVGSYYNPGGWK